MFHLIRTYSSYKAFPYMCGRRLGEDSWCGLGIGHSDVHDVLAEERWTTEDDIALAALLNAAVLPANQRLSWGE